jgi:hypothetical protein
MNAPNLRNRSGNFGGVGRPWLSAVATKKDLLESFPKGLIKESDSMSKGFYPVENLQPDNLF